MKKSKFLGLLAVGLLIGFGTAFAQSTPADKENHDKLTEHHKNAKEHSDAIASGKSKSIEEHKKHATEAGKSLNEAKSRHGKIKAADKGKNSEAHAAIEKNHADADKHLKSLNDELAKPKPDEAKVKEHAKNHSDAIDKAHQEHEKLKKKS